MNSTKLIATYSQDYYDFFIDKPIVISMPFCMSWCGDISEDYLGFNIKQKIPLKLYMSMRPTSKTGYNLWTFTAFNIKSQSFETTSVDIYLTYSATISEYLSQLLPNFPIEDGWWEFSFFSELPKDVGLWFDQIILTLVICWLYRIRNELTDDTLEELQTTSSSLVRSKNGFENELFTYVEAIEKIVFGCNYSTGYVLSSYFDGSYPFATIQQATTPVSDFFVGKLNRVFKLTAKYPDFPLDFGLIYTGKPVITTQVIKNIHSSNKYLDEVMDMTDQYLSNSRERYQWSKMEWFISWLKAGKINHYLQTLASTSLELFGMFYKVFVHGFTESNLKYFIYAINKIRYSTAILRRTSSYLRTVIDVIYGCFGKRGKMLGLGFNDSNIMSWTLVFVMYAEAFRETMENAIEQTHIDTYDCTILYRSREDGYQQGWLIFDQDIYHYIKKDIPSDIWEGNKWDTNKSLHSYYQTQENSDIVLDMVTMKLSIWWTKVSSKELISQSMTVEILALLLSDVWAFIPNRKLPKSSYTSNKHDFQSKIIKPLLTVVKDRLGKELLFECKWTTTDFHVILDIREVNFSVIPNIVD